MNGDSRRAGRAAFFGKWRSARIVLAFAAASLASCMTVRAPTHPQLAVTAQQGDALALSDALEALIAAGQDTPTDREYAYEMVRKDDTDTAAATFARAAITGRVVQTKGLLAANLVAVVEREARRSRQLDPNFRNGAATRLLGTLYVIAPATLLEHGDSETGLQLLEDLTAAHPEVPENHLRLAEAYVTLNDPEPATVHLCYCIAHRSALRGDDQRLLKELLDATGPLSCPTPTPAG